MASFFYFPLTTGILRMCRVTIMDQEFGYSYTYKSNLGNEEIISQVQQQKEKEQIRSPDFTESESYSNSNSNMMQVDKLLSVTKPQTNRLVEPLLRTQSNSDYPVWNANMDPAERSNISQWSDDFEPAANTNTAVPHTKNPLNSPDLLLPTYLNNEIAASFANHNLYKARFLSHWKIMKIYYKIFDFLIRTSIQFKWLRIIHIEENDMNATRISFK